MNHSPNQARIVALNAASAERDRQDAKWASPEHNKD